MAPTMSSDSPFCAASRCPVGNGATIKERLATNGARCVKRTDQGVDRLLRLSFKLGKLLVKFPFQIPVRTFGRDVEDILGQVVS